MRHKFNVHISELTSPNPAVQRILIEVGVGDNAVRITSTTDEKDTIDILDAAMEAIDGKRLPSENQG